MSTIFNALHELRFGPAREIMNEEPPAIPPPPSRGGDSLFHCGDPELDLHWLFNFMTSSEDVPRFKKKSIRLQKHTETERLMGMSDDVDVFFFAAIMRLFLDVMTDKYASYVAIKGMRVFQQDKRELMYEHILRYALYLARDKHGCIALNEIITDLDDPDYRNQLLDIVANNALLLSNDAYGNFVVQHVLKLRDYRCTRNIADNLRGHCVELSFKKYGSYIVERLLEVGDSVMELVVMDLLACKREMLMRLARSEYGNFVVCKALGLTNEILTADLYCGLVRKLMPYRHLLHRSPGSKIAAILDSMHVPN
ncbi:unnamed protein product [Arabidopsis arenosa]|uniref:PUM-HD domain-containing protein n=1 Tax=Arabidopsis arenosa TaxID=38785 RepID=A0A8S2B635_ARAAE|nr:unnamed protein product [Arabidopsis arenosa]